MPVHIIAFECPGAWVEITVAAFETNEPIIEIRVNGTVVPQEEWNSVMEWYRFSVR